MAIQTASAIGIIFLITWAQAAPKAFTCMSYLEDDKFMQDDDDFDEYSVNAEVQQSSIENQQFSAALEPDTTDEQFANTVPHRRICQPDYTFCFALWRQTENGTHIEKQGCWKESTEHYATCSQTECTSSAPTSRNNSLYYCCCSGDVCNLNVSVVDPAPLLLSNSLYAVSARADGVNLHATEKYSIWHVLLILLLLVFVATAILATYFFYHNKKEKPVPEEAPLAPSGPGYSSNSRNVDNINLICMLGTGKYGTVMKGLLHDQEVAVKIFPESHYQYYINERNIYSLPMMDSPSLLAYFGCDERHTMEDKIEYQLVLSLAPLGCLQDWLIANAMDFETFCGMAKSITRGLSHLHTELRRGDEHKPCVAHRDLNSRNVLVKADRSCCIADFGFALKVFGSKYEYKGEVAMAETKSINEVGTLRYMAPELLEGAVNLRDCETSLKQMDVYALGLVLWEVATRCADFYAVPAQLTPPYKAPYEQEVGTHPSFDQMQALVVRHKARPLFPPGWGGGAASKLVKDTCEDCWDHDAEARLTSLCAEERMQEVVGLRPRGYPHAQSPSPMLSANNLLGTDHVDGGTGLIKQRPATMEVCHSETIMMLSPPPNQQIQPRARSMGNECGSVMQPTPEKNHLICTQQPLQPYQGRNPCQERNLAPITTRPPQVLVEKSKKHSFQTGNENSFSCLEDDVSVEDLISGGNAKKLSNLMPENASSMGQGFPKQHNTDRKLRGWHGVRALIQKKLFRKEGSSEVFRQQLDYGDEKSNLVDNRFTAAIKATSASYIDGAQCNGTTTKTLKTTTIADMQLQTKRPNNLDLSPLNAMGGIVGQQLAATQCGNNKSNLITQESTNPLANDHGRGKIDLQNRLETRTSTPCHVVPRSLSTNLNKNININNNNNNNKNKCLNSSSCTKPVQTANMTNDNASSLKAAPSTDSDGQFRRQHSLEVFREVFSGRGSTDKLRDPSQRVKTPGDVPPSVRKVRASKTLSLYDDRMMDSSTLNIL